jgi:hypothetical protein
MSRGLLDGRLDRRKSWARLWAVDEIELRDAILKEFDGPH